MGFPNSRCDAIMISCNLGIRIEAQGAFPRHPRLRFPNVLPMEEELSVQVAQINGVQIDLGKVNIKLLTNHLYIKNLAHPRITYNFDICKAAEHKVLEHLAANSAGSHHQHLGLFHQLL